MSEEVKVRRRRGYTRVSPKHQITIPVEALAVAGIKQGDELRVVADGPGRLILTRPADVIARYAGSMPGVWEPGDLEALRDEWR